MTKKIMSYGLWIVNKGNNDIMIIMSYGDYEANSMKLWSYEL